MLTIVYKLIVALLVGRISSINKDVVSPQRIGFIQGRSILENISLAWMMVEWVIKNEIHAILILLDSEKAFDKVEHPFIWAVLEKLGLGGTFLTLVCGLLSGAFLRSTLTAISPRRYP